jgi:hypothetical protein
MSYAATSSGAVLRRKRRQCSLTAGSHHENGCALSEGTAPVFRLLSSNGVACMNNRNFFIILSPPKKFCYDEILEDHFQMPHSHVTIEKTNGNGESYVNVNLCWHCPRHRAA